MTPKAASLERQAFSLAPLKLLFKAALAVCVWSTIAPAQPPTVMLDGNPETAGISPAPASVIAGEKLTIAVTVENARNVHSYSVKLTFDPGIVSFDGAAAGLSPQTPAFLESNKGRIAAFLPVAGNGTVEIAAAQSGQDPALCAAGSGTLGYLYFTARSSGNPRITVTEARLIDVNGASTFTGIR